MNDDQTIVAISSAVGVAARMIVRVSGARAHRMAIALFPEIDPTGGNIAAGARRLGLCFGGLKFPAWVYSFRAPKSYTGEDLIEFHIPGNPVLARMLLDEIVRQGARQAEPGEFTARAYFNGKLDLSQAEGVAAAVAAHSQRQSNAARKLMAGELSRRLRPVLDLVAETLALVEVGIDFSEEDVSFLSASEVIRRATTADDMLSTLVRESSRFERIDHQPTIVLIGRPNAGKSTLLNALANFDRAVVSNIAGTTRDVLTAHVMLPGGQVKLNDVAGIEEEGADAGNTEDEPGLAESAEIARQMRRRALAAAETSDLLVLVREAGDDRPPLQLSRRPDLWIESKSDRIAQNLNDRPSPPPDLRVSAVTGENIDILRQKLSDLAFGAATAESALALNARHLAAIAAARESLCEAIQAAGESEPAIELLAADLRSALDHLGEILGAVSPDDVLGKIFSAFCIGK
jgi:tRNA modification GTPase